MLLLSKQMQQVERQAVVLPVVEQQEGAVEVELQPQALPVQEPLVVKQMVQVVQLLPAQAQVETEERQALALEPLPEQEVDQVRVQALV
jgi:hypothetical protein